jgi:hypothetical protein
MAQSSSASYPPARRADVVDDYFGTKVADPYRWGRFDRQSLWGGTGSQLLESGVDPRTPAHVGGVSQRAAGIQPT